MRNNVSRRKIKPEGQVGLTEDPNETGDGKFVMAVIYSFRIQSQ